MTKRFRLVAALLLALSFVAAACGGSDDSTDTATGDTATDTSETTATTEATDTTDTSAEDGAMADGSGDTLLIWADERKIEPLEAIAPAFTEATGVEVQVELVPFGEIRDRVTQAGPAGEGPDLFTGAHDWTGELAANGVIDAVDLSATASNIVPVALGGFTFESQTYALPYVTEAVALYRNTDLVPDVPASFDDIPAACEAAGVENCVALPGGGAVGDAYHQYPFVSAYGGYIFGYDEATGFDAADVGLDSPEAIKGAEYMESMVTDGVIPSTDYDTAKNMFLEGKAAFWITGPWELGALRDQDTVNWDVSVIPAIGDNPVQPFVGAQGFFLSSFSENKLLAQTFLLDFLATDETMQALYDADPRGTAWQSVADGLTADPQVQVFAEAAANGVPMPNIPQMASVWGPLGDNLLLVRNGELTAAEAMTTSAEDVRTAVGG